MWELYEKMAGNWFKVCKAPTGDRCKTVAKQIAVSVMRPGRTSVPSYREFLVRDPYGRDWMKTVNTESWRINWEWCQ
jgi:hypothetical protein